MTATTAAMKAAEPAPCGCAGAPAPAANHAVSLSRIQTAAGHAQNNVGAKLGKGRRLLEESQVHSFARGFGVGTAAATKTHLVFCAAGTVDNVPVQGTLKFDLAFFDGEKTDDVLWIDVEMVGIVRRSVRLPLRGVGVMRDPETRRVLRVTGFELATDLLDIDVEGVVETIACILACVGWFCGLACAPACVTVIACIACLIACVGTIVPTFLACIAACGIAIDSATSA